MFSEKSRQVLGKKIWYRYDYTFYFKCLIYIYIYIGGNHYTVPFYYTCRKAFVSMNRSALWYKLIQDCVDINMFNTIYARYVWYSPR